MDAKTLAFVILAKDKASNVMGKIGQASDGLGGKIGKFAKAGAAAFAGFAAAGAAALATVAASVVGFGLQKGKADALLRSQLGVTPEQAKALGKATGKLYGTGLFESIDAAAATIRATIQNELVDPNAGANAIAAVSDKVSTVATLMEEDAGRVAAAVSQMLRTGLVRNADEAFDLLVASTQRGLNKSADLLDTLEEYGTQFRALGLNGKQSMGLVAQALAAGARNADVAADALKEFAIRAVDGSKLSAAGFQALGLDAEKMTRQIAGGGQGAAAGLDLVLDRLREIEDPVKRNQAAVALFGTKAEDLQKALLGMDLTTAVDSLGKLEGAASDAGKAMESPASRIESFVNTAKTALAEKLQPAVDGVLDSLKELSKDPEIAQQWKDLADKIGTMASDFAAFLKSDEGKSTIRDLGLIVGLLTDITEILGKGTQLSITVGMNAIRVFVATSLNMFGALLTGATNAFGWIPGIGPKLKEANKKFWNFAAEVNTSLGSIRDKTVKVNIDTTTMVSRNLGFRAHGGPAPKGQPLVVGDGGRPELFVPDEDGVILPSVPKPFGATGAGGAMPMGGGGRPQVVLNISPTGGDELTRALISIFQRWVMSAGGGDVQAALGRSGGGPL